MAELCVYIAENCGVRTEIETNGSADLREIADLREKNSYDISFTVDYKLPSSGMEKYMLKENYLLLTEHDSVKFVSADENDLLRAKEIIEEFGTVRRFNTIFSPVFGSIKPERIVEFILENRLMSSRIQLQLHKFIWDPDKKGV